MKIDIYFPHVMLAQSIIVLNQANTNGVIFFFHNNIE